MRISIPIALGAALLLLSHAVMAASFDCTKAKSIPEHLICDTPALSAADDQLSAEVGAARALVPDKQQFAKSLTAQWNWREKNCQDVECVKSWYARQHEALTKLIASLSSGMAAPAIPTASVPIRAASATAPPWGKRITATDLFTKTSASRRHLVVSGLSHLVTKATGQRAATGAWPSLYAATHVDLFGGEYIGPRGPGEMRGAPTSAFMSAIAQDESVAAALWDQSVAATGVGYEELSR